MIKSLTGITLALAGLSILAAGGAKADTYQVGMTYGTFSPSKSNVRENFGKSWSRFSIGRVDTTKPLKWQPSLDIATFYDDGPGTARLYAITWGYERALVPDKSVQPYSAIRVGPYYGDITAAGGNPSGNGFGLNANAALGVAFNQQFFIEARYDFFSRMAGFNFDGLTLSAGVKLFDISL